MKLPNHESFAEGLKRTERDMEIDEEMRNDDQYFTQKKTDIEELTIQLKRLNDNFEYYLDQTLGNAELPLPWK